MSKIKHIIFPVDLSARSNCAAPFVAEMAHRHDAKVSLFAVAHSNYAGAWPGHQ